MINKTIEYVLPGLVTTNIFIYTRYTLTNITIFIVMLCILLHLLLLLNLSKNVCVV